MELRNIVILFKKDLKVFFGIIGGFLLIGILFFLFQGNGYNVSLTFNITRDSSTQTEEYSYDDFYRLQADERFADTVVRWLQSPSIVSDIYTAANVDTTAWSLKALKNALGSQRLSSQIVAINYSAESPTQADAISEATVIKLNAMSQDLNAQQNEKGWFVILSEDPIIKSSQESLMKILSIVGVIGIFVAFWTVIVRHYYHEQKKDSE